MCVYIYIYIYIKVIRLPGVPAKRLKSSASFDCNRAHLILHRFLVSRFGRRFEGRKHGS